MKTLICLQNVTLSLILKLAILDKVDEEVAMVRRLHISKRDSYMSRGGSSLGSLDKSSVKEKKTRRKRVTDSEFGQETSQAHDQT